jgi:glycosyltransferase involved in cell wall biosynthesis
MKPFIVVQGPVATRSGYGNHTRDLVTSLIRANKYEIQIISLPWGSTPADALKSDNPDHVEIIKCIAAGNINRKPDVFIQVSVPNEFQPHGNFNIGITAGIETNQVSSDFIIGCNKMDLIITTSQHSKDGFIKSTYDQIDEKTKQKVAELSLQKPIEVLFEGIDTDVYKRTNDIHDSIKDQLSMVTESFAYLFVGHWLKGNLGQDRKDIGMLVKTFAETYKNKAKHNRPALVLKTSGATFSIMDRNEQMQKIQQILAQYGNKAPSVYLLHGNLTDQEMNSLYNHPKIKAMVSFTKGEGFGRPLLEFTATGKPVIASGWSGHVDFLKDYSILLPGDLTDIHDSAADKFLLKGSKWFTVNYQYASAVLKDMSENYKKHLVKSKQQMRYTNSEFTLDNMADRFVAFVDEGLKKSPQEVSLKLPKLKKVGTAETPTLKLPKLKKVEV